MSKWSYFAFVAFTFLYWRIESPADFNLRVNRIPSGANPKVEVSQGKFLFSDFGSITRHGLESNTVPLKLSITGLVLAGRQRGWIAQDSLDYQTVFKKFGFFTPQSISGYPLSEKAFQQLPLGLTQKQIKLAGSLLKVEGMNISCSSCHTGRLYNESGVPTDEAMIGIPNTSVNFQLYLSSVFDGLNLYVKNEKASYQLLKKLFPKTKLNEKSAIRLLISKIVKKRVNDLNQTIHAVLPFESGSPGVTNGVASMKYTLGVIRHDTIQPEYGFTSIPSIGDRFLRSSLLYDGVYYPTGKSPFISKTTWTEQDEEDIGSIVATFTIPTMGQTPVGVMKYRKELVNVTRDVVNSFRTPKFPGHIEKDLATEGFSVYQKSCAGCHGQYELNNFEAKIVEFPNRHVPQEEMKTDPHRWQAFTPALQAKLKSFALSDYMSAKNEPGYVAPLLTSLWITAPYLHNGSVPTLWHFMRPEKRPSQFQVGGHHLDYKKMGILLEDSRYPTHVQPLSQPEMYDTTKPGRSNQGHVKPFDELSEDEKSSLLEFLKLL